MDRGRTHHLGGLVAADARAVQQEAERVGRHALALRIRAEDLLHLGVGLDLEERLLAGLSRSERRQSDAHQQAQPQTHAHTWSLTRIVMASAFFFSSPLAASACTCSDMLLDCPGAKPIIALERLLLVGRLAARHAMRQALLPPSSVPSVRARCSSAFTAKLYAQRQHYAAHANDVTFQRPQSQYGRANDAHRRGNDREARARPNPRRGRRERADIGAETPR